MTCTQVSTRALVDGSSKVSNRSKVFESWFPVQGETMTVDYHRRGGRNWCVDWLARELDSTTFLATDDPIGLSW